MLGIVADLNSVEVATLNVRDSKPTCYLVKAVGNRIGGKFKFQLSS